jgi:sterol desaturase/sphingolipid hydroxylase (fatty acid hydroxylase superfamily)
VDLTTPAIPFFLGAILLEMTLRARRQARGLEAGRGFTPRDTAASLAMGVGSILFTLLQRGWGFALYVLVYQARLFELETTWAVVAIAVVAEDFCYYWFHRMSHEVRILWAGHVNHHSSTHYNLSTALRQPWTTFAAPLFYLPLALAGFDPLLIVTVHSINLIYQFWIHTELIDRLGPLEWVMNTPSHHRVHHGRNVRYLDRNHAGIFIVWDRLFGTFQAETERVDFGLTKNIHSHNPLWIAFHEWVAMFRDAGRAQSLGDAVRFLLKPPGWSPDGSTRTARELQRELDPAPIDGLALS